MGLLQNLGKLARVAGTLVRTPSALGKVLLDPEETAVRERIEREYGLGRGLPTIDLLDLVPSLDERIDPYCFMNGSSRTIDLALLKALARRFPHCRYLEIGTLRGESLVNVASLAQECVSVSLSNADMQRLGWSNAHLKNNGLFLGDLTNLTPIGHDSRTLDFSTLGTFDLIFVDGDHGDECLRNDTKKAFQVLRDEHSMIVWHDYGLNYETVAWHMMAGILDATPKEERRYLYHVGNTLCAIYTRHQLPASMVEHPAIPNKVFTVSISARRL